MKKPKTNQNNNIAVIYARYSSSKQNDESIEQQVAVCQTYATEHGYKVMQVYSDRAVTGTDDKRESFQRMIRDSELGQFGVILAYKSNRISRDMLQALQYQQLLTGRGIRIVYAREEFDNTATGRFMMRNMMNMNQFYSENLSEDVKRGMNMGAKEGKAMSKPPFGYKIENGQFVIDPERVGIVREIFDMYLSGAVVSEIVDRYKSVTKRNGTHLVEHTIRSMLSNPFYVGEYSWNGIEYKNIPAIIDRDAYDQVQKLRASNVQHPFRHQQSEDYLLSGLLWCDTCQTRFIGYSCKNHDGKVFRYYRCKSPTCPHRYLSKDKLEQLVFDETRKFAFDTEKLDQAANQVYQYMVKKSYADKDMNEVKQKLEQTKTKIAGMISAIENGLYTPDMKQRMLELTEAKEEYEREIKRREKPFNLTLNDVKQFLYNYAHTTINASEEESQKLLSSFLYRIDVLEKHLVIYYNIFKLDDKKETPSDLYTDRVSLIRGLVNESGAYTNLLNGMLVLIVPYSIDTNGT